jgi:hypothetical protein
MIKLLKNLFELIFMNPKITDVRLKNYSEDALKRLAIQNTVNLYDTMINDTEAKHIDYFGAIDDKDTIIAIKESRTMSVDNIIVKFIEMMRNFEDVIAGKFGRKSSEFHEFFPNKFEEYQRVTKSSIGTLLHRMVKGLSNHEELGEQMKNDVIAMQTLYNAARGEQVSKKAAVDAIRTEVKDKRLVLASQLQDNLFDIAKQFKGHPERLRDFFTLHLLLPHSHKDKEGNIIYDELTLPVPKNSQKDSGIVFTPATKFQFYNDGPVPIIIMLTADDINQMIPANPMVILPDQLCEMKASEIGPANCMHLRLINTSDTTDGQLTIDILE